MKPPNARQVATLEPYLTPDDRHELLAVTAAMETLVQDQARILSRARMRKMRETGAGPQRASCAPRKRVVPQPVATMKPVRVSPKMAAWLAAQERGERG